MAAYIYRGPRREPSDETVPADQRIIDAAIDLYGDRGFTAVSLRTIATQAEVSAPLIIHHFGSKDGLRRACDRYAAEIVNHFKTEAVASGHDFTLEMMLGRVEEVQPILRYIIQSLVIGGPEIDTIMDVFVDHAVTYVAEAVESGLVKPATDERRRAVVLLLQGLGAIMLHRQMKRLLGVNPLDDSPSHFGTYLSAVMEIYTQGVFEPDAFGDLRVHLDSSIDPEPHDAAA
ncbi:TetR family transcriptional regulator [Nesterenkonia muleiensis]|uniref:TetR family transcriptional regulator n=1 Tax=Nesterenkonia muleiensis TaxID=2282648 RepID=UPI000E76A8C9|nr:TetR family transcriptional regulator [Nesterenkonia muleiensis]